MNAILNWFRKLPIAAWIKPLWKPPVKALISNEVENFRAQAKAAVSQNGEKDVDALFASFEAKLDAGIKALPIPAGIKALIQSLDDQVDAKLEDLRKNLDAAIESRGPGAIDAAFDLAKSQLLAQIDAL